MKRFVLVLLVVLLAIVTSGFLFLPKEPSPLDNQVVAIPAHSEGHLLEIQRHLRFTPRPPETFNFPIALGDIGPAAPLYAGAKQYPFYCMTRDSGFGEPVVDNQDGLGGAVLDAQNKRIGFSKDCGLPSQLWFVTEDHQGELQVLSNLPESFKEIAYLYRAEVGTINRFIYAIIAPIPLHSDGRRQEMTLWNQKLIYHFSGGSGIGFRQGRMRLKKLIDRRREQLHQGYAVISSTGNRTSYTYNMLLAEDTARRVKKTIYELVWRA